MPEETLDLISCLLIVLTLGSELSGFSISRAVRTFFAFFFACLTSFLVTSSGPITL